MFAIVKNGIIQQTIRSNRAFRYNGVDYSDRWNQRMPAADKAALGIKEIVQGPRADERFYWVSPDSVRMVDGKPTQTYTALAKDLDVLKAQFIAQAKDTANKELAATDWMVIRKAERNIDLPEETQAQRAAIIKTCTDKETAIAAATTVDELIAVIAPVAVQQEVVETVEETVQPIATDDIIALTTDDIIALTTDDIQVLSGNAEGNSDV